MRIKPKKTTQECSKFTSLERLKQIQRDRYVGANGVDYCQESIDNMIREKQSKQAEQATKKLVDQWDEYEEFMRAEIKNRLREGGIL